MSFANSSQPGRVGLIWQFSINSFNPFIQEKISQINKNAKTNPNIERIIPHIAQLFFDFFLWINPNTIPNIPSIIPGIIVKNSTILKIPRINEATPKLLFDYLISSFTILD